MEERYDALGRKFFVDHNTKSTSWTRPPSNDGGTKVFERDEQLARRLQMEEDHNLPKHNRANRSDEVLARKLQQEEVSAYGNDFLGGESVAGERQNTLSDGSSELPLVGDFEGALRMRKELRGLGWRQVYVRIYGTLLAVFQDQSKVKAELRIELKGAELLESSSQGKIRSMKDEIFRWKIKIESSWPPNPGDTIVNGGKNGSGEIEFAAANDVERAAWFGWCIVAGANMPRSTELVAKAFKPHISGLPTPERAKVLATLAKALGTNDGSWNSKLAGALETAKAYEWLAKCLNDAPGQESAAKCVYFAARADRGAARVLVAYSAAELLLPLLTASDDGLQRWAAAALAPIVAGDSFAATKGVVDSGGIFTLVALLSSLASDVRAHALASLVALCSAVIEAAWPKSGPGSESARCVLGTLVESAIDAGVCNAVIPLLLRTQDTSVATAALEAVIALCHTSRAFRRVFRYEIANNDRLPGLLVASCGDQRYGHFALRVLADACYCIDEKTGVEDRKETQAAVKVAKALFAAGLLHVALETLSLILEIDVELGSAMLQAAARKGAGDRNNECLVKLRQDDTIRIVAAIVTLVPGAANNFGEIYHSARMMSTLVSVTYEPRSLESHIFRPQAAAALTVLTLCMLTGAFQNDMFFAVEVAQTGLLELVATSGYFDVDFLDKLDTEPFRYVVAVRTAMLAHACIYACWCNIVDGPDLILTLVAPPNGHILSKLCRLFDSIAKHESLLSMVDARDTNSLTTATLLALGTLCGAARPFVQMAHLSEHHCRQDVAQSPGLCLVIAASLSAKTSGLKQTKQRRAAARLLAAMLRCDSSEAFGHQYEICGRSQYLETVALMLLQAGLVGVIATALDDDDAVIRAYAVDAFTSISAYTSSKDRDIASGVSVLGNTLGGDLMMSDATIKLAVIGTAEAEVIRLQTFMTVEKALYSLNTACQNSAAACDALAYSPGFRSTLVSFMSGPLSRPSDFTIRCSGICLSTTTAIISGDKGRATALAEHGVCDAAANILLAATHDKDGRLRNIETLALISVSTFAAFSRPRITLAATISTVASLFLKLSKVIDVLGFKLASVALSALLHLADSADAAVEPKTPKAVERFALAARHANTVDVLTLVLEGGWLVYCKDCAKNDILMYSTRHIITTIANVQNNARGCDVKDDAPFYLGTSKGFPSSALLVDSDNKHHFEKRYSLWLQQLPNAEPGDTTNGLSGADAATLVSLIAAPEPLNDAIRIAAHQTAVDHASVALRDIMLRDMSGSAATKVIQGGALARLLMLALKSPSSAGCLVVLCQSGDIHKPLLFSTSTTPAIASTFVDTIVRMLCLHLGNASDFAIVQAAIKILFHICENSDGAAVKFACILVERQTFSLVITRLATIASLDSAVVKSSKNFSEHFPSTFVLLTMLPTHQQPHQPHNSEEELIRSMSVAPASNSSSLVKRLQVTSANINTLHFSELLEPAALGALTKVTPILLRMLLILPKDALRLHVSLVFAEIITQIPKATWYLRSSSSIEAIVNLIIDSKLNAIDIALGLNILSSLVNSTEHATHIILAHADLVLSVKARIIQSSAMKTEPLALAALSLFVKLSDADRDVFARVASKEDMIQTLVLRARREVPHTEKALSVLANVSSAGVSRRDTVAGAHDIINVLIDALETTTQGVILISATRLVALIMDARNIIDLTISIANLIMSTLESVFTSALKYVLEVRGTGTEICPLISVLEALTYYSEGLPALRLPWTTSGLVALLEMTTEVSPNVAEVCANQLNILSLDPYHLKILKSHHLIALVNILKLSHADFIQLNCLVILNNIARVYSSYIVKYALVEDIDAICLLVQLCTNQATTHTPARRLAAALEIDYIFMTKHARTCRLT